MIGHYPQARLPSQKRFFTLAGTTRFSGLIDHHHLAYARDVLIRLSRASIQFSFPLIDSFLAKQDVLVGPLWINLAGDKGIPTLVCPFPALEKKSQTAFVHHCRYRPLLEIATYFLVCLSRRRLAWCQQPW
jgi:hypothetical protein